MIVVDASALVAVGDREPEAPDILRAIEANTCVITGINYVETGLVLIGRRRLATQADLDEWLDLLGISVHVGDELSAPALAAYLIYGRGYHRAGLNLADCFAYALAKELDAPLLYKGNDFASADVRSVLQPT